MNNRNSLWVFSGCTVVVLCCVSLLPTTIAETEVKVSQERKKYCEEFGNFFKCGSGERLSLVSYTQTHDIMRDDEDLKGFLDAASKRGVDKVCEEFRNASECVKSTIEAAEKECGPDMGTDYVCNLYLVDFFVNTVLKDGSRLCRTHFGELSENFQCVTNSGFMARMRSCAAMDVEAAGRQCLQDEIDKTENCKSGVFDVIKAFVEAYEAVEKEFDEVHQCDSKSFRRDAPPPPTFPWFRRRRSLSAAAEQK